MKASFRDDASNRVNVIFIIIIILPKFHFQCTNNLKTEGVVTWRREREIERNEQKDCAKERKIHEVIEITKTLAIDCRTRRKKRRDRPNSFSPLPTELPSVEETGCDIVATGAGGRI